jgi:hypothetical protein
MSLWAVAVSPARTRHQDPLALDATVEVAAVLVLLEEGVERVKDRHECECSVIRRPSALTCDHASAPPRLQHHAQDAVEAEPGVPEPYDHIPRFRGCPSNGERCDVCEVLIADTVIEGISSEVTRRKPLQMHICCFALWDEIRNEPRS